MFAADIQRYEIFKIFKDLKQDNVYPERNYK